MRGKSVRSDIEKEVKKKERIRLLERRLDRSSSKENSHSYGKRRRKRRRDHIISLIPCLALNLALILQLLFLVFFSSSLGARRLLFGLAPFAPSNLIFASSILEDVFVGGDDSEMVWSANSGVALRIAPCSGRLSTLLVSESMRRRGLV